jgi:hypothetical protein
VSETVIVIVDILCIIFCGGSSQKRLIRPVGHLLPTGTWRRDKPHIPDRPSPRMRGEGQGEGSSQAEIADGLLYRRSILRLRRRARIDIDDDAETGTQTAAFEHFLREHDADRKALDHLGKVAGGVFSRQ